MTEEKAHLPLAITPEELEMAEIAVLLDFLRENATHHDVSGLREQALAVGYRASVVDRAVEDFEKEPRPEPEPAPEPPPVRVEERPRPAVSPIPAPPPPRAQAFFETLTEEEKAALARPDLSELSVPPWLALLIVVVNALVLSLAFTNLAGLAFVFFGGELSLAAVLAANRSARRQLAEHRRRERIFSGLPVEATAAAEPSRTPVPPLPHEVRTETPPAQNVPERTPSRHG